MAVSEGLNINQLKALAKGTAADTLNRLRAQIVAIERTFPELALPKGRRTKRRSTKNEQNRTRMSLRARRAVSLRMKRYWAEKRKAKIKAGK